MKKVFLNVKAIKNINSPIKMITSENSTTTGNLKMFLDSEELDNLNSLLSEYNNEGFRRRHNKTMNYHMEKQKNKIPTNTSTIAIKMGVLLIIVFSSLSRKGNNRNFKFYNVNYEEQNNSDSDSNPSFDFYRNLKREKIMIRKIKTKSQGSLIVEQESTYSKI
ncbi:hypothetical protein H8356DRAFT_1428465 [Neocallimastix lanati (nom. inval.)]|nr:hypothetical protein H8356DRAFT_1428465 [Neocallimastix sp. JGI-2020a]